ncbi:unnamed protein product [Adineta ricciae]|uniref:Uncharacterized protein n=1 Tax=Adineta ricciae TaxID=249248 RepID=A0A815Z009_ADIRI|nr:unnamed protein product [Adineta ricciae]
MSDDHQQYSYSKPSLLQYEHPRLIINHEIFSVDHKRICRATVSPCLSPVSFYDKNLNLFDPYSDRCRPADILDFLLPPIETTNKTNHKYIICVSRHPATKADVYSLEKHLNQRLKQSQAREIGLCNHRRRIYDECFDELIRQVTIECSERGILLSRVRNTYRQLMKSYLNNYLSANAYAMRTLLLSQQEKMKFTDKMDRLQYEIEQVKKQLMNAEDYHENVLKLYSRMKSTNEYRYRTRDTVIPLELQQLRTTHQSLKHELENVLLKKLNRPIPDRTDKHNEDELENTLIKAHH